FPLRNHSTASSLPPLHARTIPASNVVNSARYESESVGPEGRSASSVHGCGLEAEGAKSLDSPNPGRHTASQKQRHSVTPLSPILLQRFAAQRLVLVLQITPIGDARGQTDRRVVASFFLRRARARSRERG